MRGCCTTDGKSYLKGLQRLLVNISILLLSHFQRRVDADGATCGCWCCVGRPGSWALRMLLWGCAPWSAASQEATECQSTVLSFSSQYLAFFEFNNRLEAILSKAYIYR